MAPISSPSPLTLKLLVLVAVTTLLPVLAAPGVFDNKLPKDVRLPTVSRSWMRACYISRTVPYDLVEADLCTHLLVFFGHIGDDGKLFVGESDVPLLAQLVKKREEENPDLRVCLTVGGSPNQFAGIAASNDSRETFAQSAAQLMEDNNLDGLDLDWEFPAFERPLHERRDFSLLLETLQAVLKAMSRPRLLSVAVGAPTTIVDVSYEVPRVAAAVDFASVMTYDYHFFQTLTPATGHNSPLYPSPADVGYFAELNCNYSMNLWLQRGMPREKLLMGLPTYGRDWKLLNPDRHGLYAPAIGPWEDGYASLADVCRLLQNNGTEVWDSFGLVPYAYSGAEWVSFENARSIIAKATLVRALDLAGAMVFDMAQDDWENVCGEGPLPLFKLIREMLPTMK
ncbi:acidic mammalian chitinase-like [Amphibalanus amphitrite]|uniref:acidic mammalian chitinase-like n=1 Tax=Amphibalanus amphitrite TaxID=1232801 RepID=UPI001C90821C|nr:acidic mammalian chitinase-like [Amphibalanus amphitrite]